MGYIYKNGITYGGGPGSGGTNTVVIPETEYNKLSTQEKNNGTVYIKYKTTAKAVKVPRIS